MKLAAAVLICAAGLTSCVSRSTTVTTTNAIVTTSQAVFTIAKTDVLKSADKIPDDLWSFQPTPEVRTVAQLFAHIADAQYEFCGPATGEKVDKGIEKTARTKPEIGAALKDAFAYCDAAFGKITDATAGDPISFFGRPTSKIAVMEFNTAHTMEHYGNLVTYMRLKGIVPPSSEGQQ